VATKPPELIRRDQVEAAFLRCTCAKGIVPMTTSAPAKKGFWQSGHNPTLLAAFLYFDVSFMVWVMLGPLAPIISAELGLDPAQAGAVLRIVNGVLGDRIGPKRTGTLNQLVVIAGLLVGWWFGIDSFAGTIAIGVILGFAGASFAVALPLASRWYPAEHQGKAMGLAGMGNSGTVLAALFAPVLAKLFGWNAVLGLAVIPLAVVFVAYQLLAKDSPEQPAPKSLAAYAEILKEEDAWWFMLFYGVTFGGFVGLSNSLSIWFVDSFALSPVVAGYYTAACVFTGSLVRPLGGALADRFGGTRTLTLVYIVAALVLAMISMGPATLPIALLLFMTVMATLGIGNGAVFQLVPQRFRSEIGVMTGLVGFAGGVGGFYLASSLGFAQQYTGSTSSGFMIFGGLALVALLGLTLVKGRWRATWGAGPQQVRI
jgi:NNP family nitrate/nitrite transporter-like MFS transporter